MAGVRGVRKSMTLSSTAADLQFAMDRCERKMISMHFIQAGKPDQNAFIKRFNKTYREEVLNAYVFDLLTHSQRTA